MLFLWRYLLGYIVIKITGENCEQILNRAAANGINIWNLHYKSGTIYGNVSIHNFFKLYNLKKGTNCKINIIKKCGIVFKLKKHKKRTGFLIGATAFMLILFFLSNFVWIIRVEGNEKISSSEIIMACKEIGIFEGVHKKKINSKYDSHHLQLVLDGIAWCSLNIEGSVLTVNVSESTDSEKDERQLPTNLKASIAGKIKTIDVASGDVLVKVGDTVSKGDLLVSGVKENMSSTLFVHSDGEIIAETNRVFSAEGEYTQVYTADTGENIRRYTIKFFNINLPLYLGNIKKQCEYSKKVTQLKLFDKYIPIKIAREEYEMTKDITVTYDKETLEKMLYKDIQKQVEEFNFISAVEGECEILYTERGILMKIPYVCEENIAVQSEILLDCIN